ncbi:hypothetical protein LTSEGIV_1242 [Salmonella enterica subsp. enterica serovar Give str. S5-487]|uniref:Uncharacterized protein n=1 Tax=Salmonella virchow (strain SL491) TaxID=465517 RepID=A0A6C8F0Y8_SALV4|nr:hypothetical protein SeV_B2351 [Salmonella enterica subsp. enterica serovar Virchow str. SL491]EHC52595.1 hypothetical protein LTSEGIV_1242 [Salmonella enterica subsp. enterica serovar Give str. S5-487]
MIPLLQFMDNMRCDNHLHFVPGINGMDDFYWTFSGSSGEITVP